LSLFVLRIKDRTLKRSFRVPLFPVVPLVFCATCAYMLYGGIQYAGKLGLVGAALLLVGVPLCLISKRGAAMKCNSITPASILFALALFVPASVAAQSPGRADHVVAGSPDHATYSPDAPAQLTIFVPADALITVDGQPMKSTGPFRRFASPALPEGKRF